MCQSDRKENSTLVQNALRQIKNSSNLLLQLQQQQKEREEEIKIMNDIHDATNKLYRFLNSSRKVAMARMETLQTVNEIGEDEEEEGEEGLSYPIVNYLLKPSVGRFLSMVDQFTSSTVTTTATTKDKRELLQSSLTYQNETKVLLKVLRLYIRLMQFDITLSEEMAKSGSHMVLSKLIYLDSSLVIQDMYGVKDEIDDDKREIMEQDEDLLTEIQDYACEIVHDLRIPQLSFPVKVSPFMKDELMNRLPLEFHVQSPYYQNNNENEYSEFDKEEKGGERKSKIKMIMVSIFLSSCLS